MRNSCCFTRDPVHDFFNPTGELQQDEGSLLPDLLAPLQDIDDVSRDKEMLSEQKMFQETNLLELLALTHILLLKQWVYSPDMIKLFTIHDLNATAAQVKEYFCGQDVEFDKDVKEILQNKLEEINTSAETLNDISDGGNDIARMARQKGLTKEAQIVRGLRNIIETFPPAGIMNEVPEMDLITSFLAPFLTPLLQSSNSRLRWPNTKLDTLEIINCPTSHRPDCIVVVS
ncbi:hypothetical protein BJV82DRAFT_667798 [Fennellomyces sp. T-0311]|nr:hypothetical protein BJV82DRAFT_667798 [Fennellomyces sp. T-0311]